MPDKLLRKICTNLCAFSLSFCSTNPRLCLRDNSPFAFIYKVNCYKNVCLWALLYYGFSSLMTPACNLPHSQFENHISTHKIVIWVIWASFISASSLLAVAISGLWVVSANVGQNKDTERFFPLQIVVKDPFPEHRERQDAHRYTLAT